MRIEMTVEDYRRLTGRCYELYELTPAAPAPQAAKGAEADPNAQDDAQDDAQDAEPGRAAPAVSLPKDDGKEKPLPDDEDGISKKAKGRWPTKPPNALSA